MQSSPADPPCPTDDALAAFVEGRLEHSDRSRLVDHVDACAGCAGVLTAYAQSYARDPNVRAVVRLRKQDAQERNERQLILETYMNALGMLAA